jgi:transcriptional regulator with XRE-family HTH domain
MKSTSSLFETALLFEGHSPNFPRRFALKKKDTSHFMKAFGEHLVRAREAAGLSLDDIHQRTRISRKNLLLLEAGDLPSIPQTYVRAFVREYARVLGLDEEDTLALYNELAERDRGVPPPPEAIDSSNLLPRIDDSVEFVPLSDRSSSHVEVEGTAEAIEDEYVPKIRKSSYVQAGSAAPIDIRTSPPAASTKQSDKPSSNNDAAAAATAGAAAQSGGEKGHSASEARSQEGATELPPPGSVATSDDTKRVPAAAQAEVQKPPILDEKTPAPELQSHATSKRKDASTRQSVYDTKPPIEEARRKPVANEDKSQERRIIGIGLVVIATVAVAVYGVYFFSFRGDSEESSIDSTAIKASIEAGRFIDSTQAALTELELPPDTLPTESRIPPEPVESKATVYARDDSLVLEAFTSAPVWFSVKMDTLRTERGSLSSNEHRTWKAREYFVVTLGDAGAVTFFLNGRELGTLGEEGAVVKNVVLSRSRIRGD